AGVAAEGARRRRQRRPQVVIPRPLTPPAGVEVVEVPVPFGIITSPEPLTPERLKELERRVIAAGRCGGVYVLPDRPVRVVDVRDDVAPSSGTAFPSTWWIADRDGRGPGAWTLVGGAAVL